MTATQARTRKRLVALFTDGTDFECSPNNPRLLQAFQAEFGKTAPGGDNVIRETCWLAWHANGRPEDLEAYIDRIDSIDIEEIPAPKATS